MSFLDILNKRYATKAMNGKVVPQEKIDNILEAQNGLISDLCPYIGLTKALTNTYESIYEKGYDFR